MSLLREIQQATVDPTCKLADILRKCKILAARLKHVAFKEWVAQELDGYVRESDLPDYRILKYIDSYGDFFGPGNSGLKNAPIPSLSLPEKWREDIATVRLWEGVGALEKLIENADSTVIRQAWPADILAYIRPEPYPYMVCGLAWRMVPVEAFVAVLDTVKNRILDFAIEIEAEAPDAGEAGLHEKPVPDSVVNHIFSQCVLHLGSHNTLGDTAITANYEPGVITVNDQSKTFHAGRDLNGNVIDSDISGAVVVGSISGVVTNTVHQLRELNTPESAELADKLVQLQAAIENESSLNPEDKVEALEQVNVLAEAGKNSKVGVMQKLTGTAIKIIRGTVASLPGTVKLVEETNKLLPEIAKLLHYLG